MTEASRHALVEVRDVTVQAGGRAILDGVHLQLSAGDLLGIIGPSGAGKSSLFKVLLGLWAPARGSVSVGGRPLAAAEIPVGYVPQQDALHGALTVRRGLDYAARLRLPDLSEEERRERIEALCGRIGLGEHLDVRVRSLSGGQRKRVSVATELLTGPPLLVLDEPTAGLDPGMERKLMELFAELAREGRAVALSTHHMANLHLCNRLLVLVQGRVAWFGPPGEAPGHFGVSGLSDIFEVLPTRTPASWHTAWQNSAARRAGP